MRRKHKKKLYVVTILIIMGVCGFINYQKAGLTKTLNQNKKQLNELKMEKKELLAQQKEIDDYESYVKTKKYVEQMAREKLGLVYKDEIVFRSDE